MGDLDNKSLDTVQLRSVVALPRVAQTDKFDLTLRYYGTRKS